jgi:hypothetical protein
MKIFLKLFVVSTLLYSLNTLASQTLIDSYICHYCNFTEAKALASAKRKLSNCDSVDLNRKPATPDNPMMCDVTNETVVILNPQDWLAWKFNVKAHFPQPHLTEVITSNLSMSTTELNNANIFFDFYDDFIEATNGGLLVINPATFETTQSTSYFNSKTPPKFSALTSATESASCFVASEYFGNQIGQDKVRNFVIAEVVRAIAGRKAFKVGEDVDVTGLGFQVGGGGDGLNISWESKERPIGVTIGSGDTKLVFDLSFQGNITASAGTYEIDLFLDRNASQIDGRSVGNSMPNGTVNDANDTTTDDYSCLRDILERAAEANPWGNFVGEGLESSNVLTTIQNNSGGTSYCVRTVTPRTCSTTREGRTCTETVYHFPVSCF